jgi:hypothetical protein
MLIEAENELERANVAAVAQHMDALMWVRPSWPAR